MTNRSKNLSHYRQEGVAMRLGVQLACVLLFCWPTLAVRADIEAPETIPTHEPLVVRVVPSQIPEGARLRGSFSADGGKYLQCGDDTYHVWAAPGRVVLRARGVWILTRDVIVDGQTLPVLLDFGSYDYEKEVVVGPDPPKPDPPDPVGPKQIMMFYEADRLDNYPAAQRELLTSLKLRQELVQAGHVVLEMVEAAALAGTAPARYKAYFDAARGQAMPVLAMAPKSGGSVRAVPLPTDKAGLLEALK